MTAIINKKEKLIIDRSIPEILRMRGDVKKSNLLKFCTMLNKLGVDLLEINRSSFRILKTLPESIGFIYRIEDAEDIEICINNQLHYGIIDYQHFLHRQYELLASLKDMSITIEVNIHDIAKGYRRMHFKRFLGFSNINCIRIYGLNKLDFIEQPESIQEIKESLNVKVDICPDNRFFQATAIAVEGIMNGADRITTVFTGNGGQYGFAALEEVLMALEVTQNTDVAKNAILLPQVCKLYKDLTKTHITKMKAVLGEDIFKYESGVHADGIEKDARNYEPYEPEKVGQRRKLVLGKHSGTRAVITKFKELDINCEKQYISEILDEIRKRSISLKREISDSELMWICSKYSRESPNQAVYGLAVECEEKCMITQYA